MTSITQDVTSHIRREKVTLFDEDDNDNFLMNSMHTCSDEDSILVEQRRRRAYAYRRTGEMRRNQNVRDWDTR